MTKRKIAIAVLASGRGSNFLAIVHGIKKGQINAEIKLLITNNSFAGAIGIAKRNHIPFEVVEKEKFPSRDQFDLKIKEVLDKYNVDLVVLAGYMLLIKSKELLNTYRNRIINIHPALLPCFPGVDGQKQAFEAGVKISGLTIHFVDESLDHGPIIFQKAVDISDCQSIEGVEKKILKQEHNYYKKVIHSFSTGHYIIERKRVTYIRDE